MVKMAFLCDSERCIECNACVTACKNEHEVPGGSTGGGSSPSTTGSPASVPSRWLACIARMRPARRSARPIASTAPRRAWSFSSKDLCIGCGYCFYACPFGAPQYPQSTNFGGRGKMDKCTFCAGGPEADNSEEEYIKYGTNRLAEGKLPLCAEMCSTRALMAGEQEEIAEIYQERVARRGYGSGAWGWSVAYGVEQDDTYTPGVAIEQRDS